MFLKIKDISFVVLSTVILIVAVIVKTFEGFSVLQWNKFELIINIVLFVIAILSFFSSQTENLRITLLNLCISGIAFVINIQIFNHEIHIKKLLLDVKNWHILWSICAFCQMIFLSGLWTHLINQIIEAIVWGKNIIKSLFSIISDLITSIEIQNKKAARIISFINIIWIIYAMSFS